MTNVLFNRIAEILGTSQRNSATHLKNVQKLKFLYLEQDHSDFMHWFEKCLHAALKTDYKLENPFVNRIIVFISLLSVTMQDHHLKNVDVDTDSPFVTSVLAFLMRMNHTANENIRCRSCEFISKMFSALIGYDLTVEICDGVQEAMLNSLEDKIPKTRILAATALAPLQSLENPHCPITEAFLEHMESDYSAKVRKICVEKIALQKRVIPQLIEASRDVDVNVKLAVFRRALKYPHNYKIIHKQQLIINGFMDEFDSVKTFVATQMIPAWLQYYELNYIKLLSGLRLDSTWSDLEKTSEVVEYTLSTLCNLRPVEELSQVLKLNEQKLVKFEDLNWDSALYWRFFIDYLRKKDADVDNLAPSLPDFRQYVEEFCIYSMNKNEISQDSYSNLEFKFILLQLFYIAKGYDYVDISCKQVMQELIKHVLKTYCLDLEVINVIILTLNVAMPSTSDQSIFICDITGELLYSNEFKTTEPQPPALPEPMQIEKQTVKENDNLNSTQDNYAIAQLKIKYFTLSEQLEEAVKIQDYVKAAELKPVVDKIQAELDALKTPSFTEVVQDLEMEEQAPEEEVQEKVTDPVIIKKVLLVMAGFLTSSKIRTLNNTLQIFKADVIDELVHSDNMTIKIAAMRCLALCCTLDEHTAKMALPTFCAIIMTYTRMSQHPPPVELVILCIGVVVDSILLFGTKLFANPPENSLLSETVNEEEQDVFAGGISLSSIIRELLELFNDENVKIQEMSCRGICYFIQTSRICSQAVISRLVLKYVSPVSMEMESIKLQQHIGITLGKLPQIPNSASQFEKAIVPTIKIVLKAPQSNPLSDVDVDNLAKLLLDLAAAYQDEGKTMHKNILQQLLKELREKPHNCHNIIYSKILLFFKISANDKNFLKQIVGIVDDLRDRICDKNTIANLIKFNTKINLMMENIVEGETSQDAETEE